MLDLCGYEVNVVFYICLDFPGGSDGKVSVYNVGDLGSSPGLGRSPGDGKSYPLQYSGLENSMDCIAHGVAKSWTQLSDFHVPGFKMSVTALDITSLSHIQMQLTG